MFNLMDGDIAAIGVVYFMVLIVTCSFFLLNLILAVIIQAFIKIQKGELEEEIKKMNKLKIVDIKQLKDEKSSIDISSVMKDHLDVSKAEKTS